MHNNCMKNSQAAVEAILIQRNEEEVNTAYSGDNIRVKLKGVEEEVCVCVCVCVCVRVRACVCELSCMYIHIHKIMQNHTFQKYIVRTCLCVNV